MTGDVVDGVPAAVRRTRSLLEDSAVDDANRDSAFRRKADSVMIRKSAMSCALRDANVEAIHSFPVVADDRPTTDMAQNGLIHNLAALGLKRMRFVMGGVISPAVLMVEVTAIGCEECFSSATLVTDTTLGVERDVAPAPRGRRVGV